MDRSGSKDCRRAGKLLENGETSTAPSAEAELARTLFMQRRWRDAAFGQDLFGEPAWDMLLTLFLAHEAGPPFTIYSLCSQTPVPLSTAHRWMLVLIGKSLLVRIGDPHDRRRSYVYLSAAGTRRTREFLRTVLRRTG